MDEGSKLVLPLGKPVGNDVGGWKGFEDGISLGQQMLDVPKKIKSCFRVFGDQDGNHKHLV